MSAYQRNLTLLVQQVRAILILTGTLKPEESAQIDQVLADIPTLTKTDLQKVELLANTRLAEIHEAVGLRQQPQYYLNLLGTLNPASNQLWFATKHFVETELFASFATVSKQWPMFPPHMRVGFDLQRKHEKAGTLLNWRLLEAALFEDMAMLWNLSSGAAEEEVPRHNAERIPLKRFIALKRSTARAGFALLEGYLNGIALDIEYTRDLTTLSDNDRELLTERTFDGLRAKFKRLRDKVVGYPRIALGLEYPPIQDNNEPTLEYILKKEREWRDAVMHPTPRIEEGREWIREQTFFKIEMEELARFVDSVVTMVRRIDKVLAGRFGSVDVWLYDRNPEDGLFPEAAFF